MQLSVRGMTFSVRAGGPSTGPVVLLLHGFPQHSGEWDAVVPALHEAGLRTVAPDQRGYSPGARPREVAAYTTGECVADALAIAGALGAERFHVVGHDWGAVVAWSLAAAHPERVATVTALSVPHPLALGRALGADPDQQRRSAYIQVFRREGTAERTLLADDAAALRALFAGSGLDDEGIERYVAPMREPGALTAALHWYRAMDLGALAATGPVGAPTTFLWGDDDLAIGRTAALGCAESVTGLYRFVPLAGVSHWIPDRAPDLVAAEVLDRISPPSRSPIPDDGVVLGAGAVG